MASAELGRAESPAITVLLPVFNGEAHLVEAVESILTQTEGDFELLALDDGSTDASPEILDGLAARDKRILVLHLPHAGLVKTLNTGIASAQGEFVARMDADDRARPVRFERQLAYMRAHPSCVAVGAAIQRFGTTKSITWYPERQSYVAGVRQDVSIAHPAAFIRTSSLRRIGGYQIAFEHAEDSALWRRLIRVGEIDNLPEVLLDYRHHSGQVSVTKEAVQALRNNAAMSFYSLVEGEDFLDCLDSPINPQFINDIAPRMPERRVRAHLSVDLAEYYADLGLPWLSTKAVWRGIVSDPLIAALRIPPFGRRWLRHLRRKSQKHGKKG